jgi:hypothetical protein
VAIPDPAGGDDTVTGYYQVLSTPAPLLDTLTGEVEYHLRGWVETGADTPRIHELHVRLGQGSLARFQLLSDERIDFLPGAVIAGAVHSNVPKSVDPIAIDARDATLAAGGHLSSTEGVIHSPSCTQQSCDQANGDVVDFAAVTRSFAHMSRISKTNNGACSNVARYRDADGRAIACEVSPTAHPHPDGSTIANIVYRQVWNVRIGSDRVVYQPALMPALDTITADDGTLSSSHLYADSAAPTLVGSSSAFDLPLGGGAIMFPHDAIVSGSLAHGDRSVTVVSRTPSSSTAGTIVIGDLLVGSADAESPVGLIAEGSIRIPKRVLDAAQKQQVELRNVALIAQTGELSLGVRARLSEGADSCSIATVTGTAPRLFVRGSIMTRRAPRVSYTDGTCTAGFQNREYEFEPRIAVLPPPLFPRWRNWSVTRWQ